MVRPKGPRNEKTEPVAQGFLGDLLGHDEREVQRKTGLALEPGQLGTWLVGEAGALLVTPDRRRVHCFCVRTTEPERSLAWEAEGVGRIMLQYQRPPSRDQLAAVASEILPKV